MSIIQRISMIVRSNVSDLISKAEDPEKIINQALEDMRQARNEARSEVVGAIAEGKKLERDVKKHREEAAEWLAKAEQAIRHEREDLAKEALRRKKAAEVLADGLQEQADKHNGMVEQLKRQLLALDAKIGEASRERQLLLARQKRAQAQRSINAVTSKEDFGRAAAAFERMSEKVAGMEDRLAAEMALENDLSLEEDFAALGMDDGVTSELAALKERMGLEQVDVSRQRPELDGAPESEQDR